MMEESSQPNVILSQATAIHDWKNLKQISRSRDEQHNFRPLGRFPPHRHSTSELTAFDLKPPPPTLSDPHCEVIAERLFSADHLQVILRDPTYFQRFRGFLNKYQPQSIPTLIHYLESQKAITAIRYANAIAGQLRHSSRLSSANPTNGAAGTIDQKFEDSSREALDKLVTEALPVYMTHRIVKLVTECLVKKITGSSSPLMQEFIQGLAEVYCLADARQPDYPNVFASEEFYNTTQYGREYVIGKNCRFLQGPKTQKAALKRISDAVHNGQEANEILLNYRRDGSPFLNLFTVSPLKDSRGEIRYYIGAQVDISHLLEAGRGLDSFRHLLDLDAAALESANHPGSLMEQKLSLSFLHDLSGLLNDDELDVVKVREREARMHGSGRPESMFSTSQRAATENRRFLGMEEYEDTVWPLEGPSTGAKLQGVYQNYILVRPYPSLRITFTSPSLRIPGLCQSKLMDRIGGPQHVRDGIIRAFEQGIGVTAKISWLTQTQRSPSPHPGPQSTLLQDGDSSIRTCDSESLYEGRPRWIHCTPLMGSDMKPGVIMIVMVDKEEITGALAPPQANQLRTIRSRPRLYHPAEPIPTPSNTPMKSKSRSSDMGRLGDNLGRTLETDMNDSPMGKLPRGDSAMSARSQSQDSTTSRRSSSAHETLIPEFPSTGFRLLRADDLDVSKRLVNNQEEEMSGAGLVMNKRDDRRGRPPIPDFDGAKDDLVHRDPNKEFFAKGITVEHPERVESRRGKSFETLLRKKKKSM